MAKVSSTYVHYLLAAIFTTAAGPPTWRLHTRLCNFVRNISTNVLALGQRTHLKLGDLSSLFIVYNITIWQYNKENKRKKGRKKEKRKFKKRKRKEDPDPDADPESESSFY